MVLLSLQPSRPGQVNHVLDFLNSMLGFFQKPVSLENDHALLTLFIHSKRNYNLPLSQKRMKLKAIFKILFSAIHIQLS